LWRVELEVRVLVPKLAAEAEALEVCVAAFQQLVVALALKQS
jgi:hypothetical protein